MITYPRVAGRLGNIVSLNMQFLHNGVLESPYAIRQIDIYRGSFRNLVDQITVFPSPDDPLYPSPINELSEGIYELNWEVPDNLVPNDIYIDVWHFIPTAVTDIDDRSNWISQSGNFWLFDDIWITDDQLREFSFNLEPLDKQFRRGEIRPIELAIHPLPKYSYDFNLLAPIIPNLNPTITIKTYCDELLSGLINVPCEIGIRQDHNRNSPFVVKCLLDTRSLIRGTYKYYINFTLLEQFLIKGPFYFTIQ